MQYRRQKEEEEEDDGGEDGADDHDLIPNSLNYSNEFKSAF